jgi:ATP-dependent exoDNAse (exonuclease V) beta subunit
MRLLYVAATRAEDRLILSGTAKDLASLGGKSETWLKWIWQSLGLEGQRHSGIIEPAAGVQIQLSLNSPAQAQPPNTVPQQLPEQTREPADSLMEVFPLLRAVTAENVAGLHSFSVTQLINYRRCPRQYYFDRVLRVPSSEELAVWNDAEAPEPPANLTATLKGAVIHRFCETFVAGDDPVVRLRQSFQELIRLRQAQFADRLMEIETEKAVEELIPLASNYLSSAVFERINKARARGGVALTGWPGSERGLWSELGFRLRRPMGILTGAIDKLLVMPAGDSSFDVEIIDFKTNRFRTRDLASPAPQQMGSLPLGSRASGPRRRGASPHDGNQISFDFAAGESPQRTLGMAPNNSAWSLNDEVAQLASDYQLQIHAYALAARELSPALKGDGHRLKVTLHFLDPNLEYSLAPELLSLAECSRAIDEAMTEIISAREPENFPVHPARHCRVCNFLELCTAGREWLGQHRYQQVAEK